MKKYKGFIEMNDGAKTGTFPLNTIEDVKKELQSTLKLTTRYYKRNGVDYGEKGKLFTYEEDHNGIKKAIIYEVTTEPHSDITEELKHA